MSDEEAEGASAQNPAAHFSGNIMSKIQCSPRKSPGSIKSIQEKVWIYLQRKPGQHI